MPSIFKTLMHRSIAPGFRHCFLGALIVVCATLGLVVPVNAWQSSAAESESSDEAAWEYRPYNVIVWVAHNNSWRLNAIDEALMSQLEQMASLTDPSGWRLDADRAPNPWNWRFLHGLDRQLYSGDLQADLYHNQDTENADKLLVVRLKDQLESIQCTVQEFDLKTQIWGAEVIDNCTLEGLADTVFQGIKTAFMPITRIENVRDTTVMVRVRAVGITQIAEQDPQGNWEIVPNTGSPVWVDEDEILLPVIIRKDRRGNVAEDGIRPVDWTFLSILERDGPHLKCETHSMRRFPLGGRTGGRTERMALCVRSPDRPTTLRFVSNDQERRPLPDLEIRSRFPGMDKEVDSEVLGKTNWRGEIVVPPAEHGLRVLLIRSGERPLAQAPVVPGLYDKLTTAMPDDERRLYAEGIVRGLENELMDNTARRQILVTRIENVLEKGDLERAEELLDELRDVDDAQRFKTRLSRERNILLLGDDRQQEYISGYFDQLDAAASKFLNRKRESELRQQLQEAKRNQAL